MSARVGVSPVLVGPRVQHLMNSAFTIKDEDPGRKKKKKCSHRIWCCGEKTNCTSRTRYKKDAAGNVHRCSSGGKTWRLHGAAPLTRSPLFRLQVAVIGLCVCVWGRERERGSGGGVVGFGEGGGVGWGVTLLILSGLFTHFYTYCVSNRPAASPALATIGRRRQSKRK